MSYLIAKSIVNGKLACQICAKQARWSHWGHWGHWGHWEFVQILFQSKGQIRPNKIRLFPLLI